MLSQGWSFNSCIVILDLGLTSRHRFKTERHSRLSSLAIVWFNLYFPDFMLSIVSQGLFPLKGSSPNSIPNKMTPVDHTSSLPSNFWFFVLIKHYGAIYPKLPVSKFSHLRVEIAPAIPKSMIFIFFY